VFRSISSRVLLAACLLSLAGARSPRPSYVVLSYYENPTGCLGCPKFQVDFREGGHVDFHGLAGCAVPGDWHYRIPETQFDDLLRAFREADFFNIPRLDIDHVAFDVLVRKVTYKDERRIHETVDVVRQLPPLTQLEERLRTAADVDRFLKPSVSLYRELLASGWNINTLGENHENALTAAVERSDLDSVSFLLQHGAKVSEEALVASTFSGKSELVELLLRVTRTDMHSALARRMLTNAAGRSAAITRLLLKNGAGVNAADPVSGETPLTAAISGGSLESTALLLARGAAVNTTDTLGRTPLSLAAIQYNSGFITLLVQHGANVNGRDANGRTPLIQAAERCFYWNIGPLLDAGAHPNIADREGRLAAALLVPSEDGKCKVSRELLESASSKRSRQPK
jgi:ankyrin repeat protein